ncbi:MAG: carboxypeptidase regulatory-like domain-containing protein, partial [Gemmatimonadaceae bacterium]
MSAIRPLTSPAVLTRASNLTRASSVSRLSFLAMITLASASVAAQSVPPDSTLATISGTVYDSLDGHSLAGALVQIVTRGDIHGMRSVRTDSTGAFHLAGVEPGDYLVGFWHVTLDSLGLDVPPRTLAVEGAAQLQVALDIPSASTIRAALCPSAEPGDSSGLLLGFVRDADTGGRLTGGVVDLSWTELVANKRGIHTVRHDVSSKADPAGWYAQCGLSTAGPIAAYATVHDNSSGIIDVSIPARGVLHRDFSIPVGAAAIAGAGRNADVSDSTEPAGGPVRHGSAQLAGRVFDENGKPLSGAQLVVWGSGIATTTRGDGTFALAGLPAGTQMVETHYLGFAPSEKVVDLASGRTLTVTVTLDDRINLLSTVTVYGKRTGRLKG